MEVRQSRPLSYDSLKAILQFWEPNLRCIFSHNIPSISVADKSVPLRINHLKLCPSDLIINQTSYRLGTYRHYPPGATVPIEHQTMNSHGGAPHDLNQHGFNDYSSDKIVTPGDLEIKGINGKPDIDDGLNTERVERELNVYKRILESIKGHNVEFQEHERNFVEGENLTQAEVERRIDLNKTWLKPYECRRDNTPTEFTKMVQLTVTYPNGLQTITRKSGEMKVYEAHKKLLGILLGNRQTPIHVKHLEVDCEFNRKMIRLPENFCMKVRQIRIYPEVFEVCNALQPIIDSSSYPLELFETSRQARDKLNHPIMKSANTFFIRQNAWRLEEPWLQEFQELTNKHVHLFYDQFTLDEHVNLIRSLIYNGREIGTRFSFGSKEETDIREILAEIRTELNGLEFGERAVRVPMSEFAEIYVSYIPPPHWSYSHTPWLLVIEIIPISP